MISDLTDRPMQVHGKVLLVSSAQRHIVERGCQHVGCVGEWESEPHGIEAYQDFSGVPPRFYRGAWRVYVPTLEDAARLQAWLNAHP